MTLGEQAARRLELARKMGCEPRRWIATPAAVAELEITAECHEMAGDGSALLGIPLAIGDPRSEWGLDLVSEPQAARG